MDSEESGGSVLFGLRRDFEAAQEVKRSRFIGRSFRCGSAERALEIVRGLRERYADADHHCWAFRVGPGAELSRYNDDGEPHGTAGPPILSVLERNRVTNALFVVTRYFGGIKLGTGGLTRAYRETAMAVLEGSGLVELRPVKRIRARVPYSALSPFDFFAAREGFEILDRSFKEDVEILLRIPVDREHVFRDFYRGLVGGRMEYSVEKEENP